MSTDTTLAATASGDALRAPSPVADFVRSHLTNHPNLIAANAGLQSTRDALRAAGQSLYNPELELDYEDAEVTTKSIGIRQTIDWGDQRGGRTAVAQAELYRATAQYEIALQSLIDDLLTGLAQYQTGEERARLSNETTQLMRDFRQIAERRYQAGDLSQVELNLARLAYNQALMQQANAQADAVEARENLLALLGTSSTTFPTLPEIMPVPALDDDLDAFLQQLPIIRLQHAEIEVARGQVDLRKSEKAWDPTIGISAGSEGDESRVGLTLSIPLNIRNSYSAEVDSAHQLLLASEQRAQQAYRNTRAGLIMTTERYRNLLDVWNNWRELNRKNVKQQLSLIKQLWLASDMNATEYLLQLKQVLETQVAGLELRNQLWRVAFDWMSLTASIDDWLNINTESLGNH